MFFVKLGSIIAWILIAAGSVRLALGFFVALGFEGADYVAASKRYLGSTSSGEAIDQGFMWLVAGAVIGLLVKISKKTADK